MFVQYFWLWVQKKEVEKVRHSDVNTVLWESAACSERWSLDDVLNFWAMHFLIWKFCEKDKWVIRAGFTLNWQIATYKLCDFQTTGDNSNRRSDLVNMFFLRISITSGCYFISRCERAWVIHNIASRTFAMNASFFTRIESIRKPGSALRKI